MTFALRVTFTHADEGETDTLERGRALLAVWLLVVCSVLWVIGSAANDFRGRGSSPETTVRDYFGALERGDVEGALVALPEASRARWTPFVENSLFNEYEISGIAVRTTSRWDQLRGAPAGPQDVTIFLEITQYVDGARWQAGPRVPLVLIVGRWYMAHPPLAEAC